MKVGKFIFVFLCLLFSLKVLSEDFTLSSIESPGGTGSVSEVGIVLAENIAGPVKVTFSGQNLAGDLVPILAREERDSQGSGIGSHDRLITLYSGRVYSGNDFAFSSKTAQEFVLMEAEIYPGIDGNIYLDLTVQASSHSIGDEVSDDAGEYGAIVMVTLTNL